MNESRFPLGQHRQRQSSKSQGWLGTQRVARFVPTSRVGSTTSFVNFARIIGYWGGVRNANLTCIYSLFRNTFSTCSQQHPPPMTNTPLCDGCLKRVPYQATVSALIGPLNTSVQLVCRSNHHPLQVKCDAK